MPGLQALRMLLALFVLTAVVVTARRVLSNREGRYQEAGGARGFEQRPTYEEHHSRAWRQRVVQSELTAVQAQVQAAETDLVQRGVVPVAAPH